MSFDLIQQKNTKRKSQCK